MEDRATPDRNEQTLAAIAHGSIILGIPTSGLGGIFTALVIWLTQRDKSDYVARQSLQALVYQTIVFLVTTLAFMCWGGILFLLTFVPMIECPDCYQQQPPPSLFAGMFFLCVPLSLWLVAVLYGIWGAIRSWGGSDFSYVFVGRLMER